MYNQLISLKNLHTAFQKAAKGKRGHPHVAGFEFNLEDNLIELQFELENQTYLPGDYSNFYIHDPKKRLISAAPFRDRVVHHALCNIIEPVFERSFIFDSYANRVGKGTHRAVDRCQYFARRNAYVLQCDLKHFFPSIDHVILQGILFQKVRDEKVRWLIKQLIESGQHINFDDFQPACFPGDDLSALLRPCGLPIGNLTSQFWANVYLNPFDHFVKRTLRCAAYLRYVDDCLLFHDNKSVLREWKSQIMKKLEQLRLTVHPYSQARPVKAGVPFLGFIIFPDKRRLKNRKGLAYRRKLRKLVNDFRCGEIDRTTIDDSIQGWINHVRYGNTVGLRKALFNDVFMR